MLADMNPLDMVTLRTGRQVPAIVIQTTTVALDVVEQQTPIFLFDLLGWIKNREEPTPAAFKKLRAVGLLDSTGNVHEYTRDVVLASFDGEDIDLARVHPIRYRAGGA